MEPSTRLGLGCFIGRQTSLRAQPSADSCPARWEPHRVGFASSVCKAD